MIGKVNPKEIIKVKKVLTKTWRDTYANLLPKKVIDTAIKTWHSFEELTKEMKNPNVYFRIYKNELGEILGVITAKKISNNVLWITRLYILPGFQRKGIGGKLLKSVIKEFPKIPKIILEVEKKNKNGIAFWTKYGFKKNREKEIIIGKGVKIPTLVMELKCRVN